MSHVRENADSEWVRALVETYAGPLTRYAHSITGDHESARDCVQETFIRLCRQARADLERHVAPWLFRVCRNRALDQQRKEARMKPLNDESLAATATQEEAPLMALERRDAARVITEHMRKLPDRQREVIRLKFQNELSYKEIAEVMEISVSNVGFVLHTAIKNLRQTLASQTDLLAEPEISQ